jgi:hypothetical protein
MYVVKYNELFMRRLQVLILMILTVINSYGQDFELVPYRVKAKWGFADSTGTLKIKAVYDDVIPFNRGYSAFKTDGKWGFLDISGKVILEAKYDSVGKYFKGFYAADKTTNQPIVVTGLQVFRNGKEDFVNTEGKNIFGEKGPERISIVDDVTETDAFKNKIELIRDSGKLGFVIKKTGFRVEPQYDSLIYSDADTESFYGNGEPPYFLARKHGKWGIITTQNTEKVAFEYEELVELEFNGKKLFRKAGKWGVMDRNFFIVLKNEYDSLIYEGGMYLAKLENKWGVFDNTFEHIIPFDYAELKMTADGKGFYVKNNKDKWGYYDKHGEIKIPLEFSVLEKFKYKDCFKYSKHFSGKGLGIINIDQTIKIEPVYDDVKPFKNGYALVLKKGKRGYINENGLEFFKK